MNDRPTIRIDRKQTVQPELSEAQVIDRKMQETGVMVHLQRMNFKKRRCWHCGRLAKEQGFVRVSPYYEDEGADAAWFAGYDGQDEPTLDALLVPVLNDEPISA